MDKKPSGVFWSDDELLRQFVQTADQEFLGQLYSRYVPLVYGLCLKYLKQTEDAEDAVTNIYEELTWKIHKYHIENFKTWLYSVAKNHCFQLLRRENKTIFEEFDHQVMESDAFENLIDVEDDQEKESALKYCMGTLPEEQRQCIVHFFFEDCSYADIAEKTGFELNKVKSYIQNGKRNLKICILKRINQ
ncbi:MAG: sigma-70 family RNA polymerase sigma factor [Bacteroidales bacterium]|nr:sigma-70 family RNA polymerase sigma factor [Bacteroidales bacterium]